ncbi:MAG: bifunctional 3-hydroxydecanoyl-ACP dehydratase/trans-2-decenoyl-ACP isomerase [Deltaproteobacteria bacterium]|nr:bifunctional 3-hydroxydecanoyl-ACP dehydratase/trans-2-decenoyl-ACP isomerase [Deltaproteobacteria bacterium]
MNYADFQVQESFTKEELLGVAYGNLFDDAPPEFTLQLPAPPMLMVDRILEIRSEGARGRIVAERDVAIDDWFFHCHFRGDPVQPGCLGVDGVWQLLGFFCAWNGGLGSGRALGCGEVEFLGQIRPHDRCVRYEIDIRRFTKIAHAGATLVIGDATLFVDDEPIYEIKRAKVGSFQGIAYADYPKASEHSRGGKMER